MSSKTSASWWNTVKVGDMLKPDPFWNKSERKTNNLAAPTKVLDIMEAQSQSGRLFKVKTEGELTLWLDAGWFTGFDSNEV